MGEFHWVPTKVAMFHGDAFVFILSQCLSFVAQLNSKSQKPSCFFSYFFVAQHIWVDTAMYCCGVVFSHCPIGQQASVLYDLLMYIVVLHK